MSQVIGFLESVGSKPLDAASYAACVAALDVSPAQRQALFERDHHALNALLGGRPKMVCFVVAPDEDMPADPDDAPDEQLPEE
jgi:hypothetical protein